MDAEDESHLQRYELEKGLCLARYELFQAREAACFHLGIYLNMLKDYKEEPEKFSDLGIKNAIENAKRLENALYRLDGVRHTEYIVMKEAYLVHVLCMRMNAAHVGLLIPDLLTEEARQKWMTFIQGPKQVEFQVKWNIIHAIICDAYRKYIIAYTERFGPPDQDWLWSIIREEEARSRLVEACRLHRQKIQALGDVVANALYPVQNFRNCALQAQHSLQQTAAQQSPELHNLQRLFTEYLRITELSVYPSRSRT